jgi:uncharacterized protein
MSPDAAPGRWDRALLLAAMAAAVSPNWLRGGVLLGPAALIVAVFARAVSRGGSPPFAVLGLAALFASAALDAPYVMVGAVAIYGIAALTWQPARAVGGFAPGRAALADALLALGAGAASSVVLAVWLAFAKPDLSDLVSRIPRMSGLTLLLAGISFALVNSVVEEVLFRGLLWAGLVASLRTGVAVVIAQAAFFGAAHYRGFPRGASGVALAMAYGLVLGIIRRRTAGILWPILSHVLPDLTIFILVAHEAGAGAGPL